MMWLKRPGLHFILLGIALYLLQLWLFPPPKPVLGPPASTRLALMADQFITLTGRQPTAQDRDRFVDVILREDLLFNEALQRDLHYRDPAVQQRLLRNMRFLEPESENSDIELLQRAYDLRLELSDEVVRRRLVQVMEQWLVAMANLQPPDQAALEAAFGARTGEWVHPDRYSIAQVFIPQSNIDRVSDIVTTIEAESLDATAARQLGYPFLAGFEFDLYSADQLARTFGYAFVEQFETLPKIVGRWLPPVYSDFGAHILFLSAYEPSRPMTLDEVRPRLARELVVEAEQRVIAEAVEQLMQRYEVRR